MDISAERKKAVASAISDIRELLSTGVSIDSIEAAKACLLSLAERRELFGRDAFPLPEPGETDRNFLLHEDVDGGYALYVNSGMPGQATRPHDHGGAWAIVVAVDGEETHRLYVPEGDDGQRVRQVGEITVQPGTGVSLLPDGIHSIHANSDEPLLHLHLYGMAFSHQEERVEYDMEAGTAFRFKLADFGVIEDAR